MKTHNLFEEKVFLNEETHTYRDKEGLRYMGFSEFSELFYPAFLKEHIASKSAEKEGCSQKEILDRWQAKTDNGSRIDKALELKSGGSTLTDEYKDVEELVDSILMDYSGYKGGCYEQVVTYNEHFRIAGSPDKFMLSSTRKDAAFEMADFKCFEDNNLHEHRGWLKAPFEHLPKTKYTKIALQLSFYSYQLELLLGKKCKRLFIHLINPITKTHQQIPVPYLRNDIELALGVHREKMLSLVYEQKYEAF